MAVTVPLFYLSYFVSPILIPDVTAQPAFRNSSIGNLNVNAMGKVNQGLVSVLINGSIFDPSVSRLTLTTGSPGSADLSQVQASCCKISDKAFVGTAQLGTPESPITGTSVVPFRLVSSNGSTLMAAGSLAVNVESLPGGNPTAYEIIGLLSLFTTVTAALRAAFPSGVKEAAG